mmetsp:Transcript_34305/g.28942  ORF Transcript_34305/g.28942 Transcript_34305/m.28942 type:complete len:103 (+) Transcript_34305:118-426(+)
MHVDKSSKWMDADETGPVADNLRSDFMISVVDRVEYVLNKGLPVLMYNGERDGSACNHIGNLRVAQGLKWEYSKEFYQAKMANVHTDNGDMVGFIKKYMNFS